MIEMMRIEAEAKVGAAKGKHAQDRTTYFPSARVRRVDTRMGTVYLLVPQGPEGRLCAVLHLGASPVVNGVSTRKIERLAQAMGIENISASQATHQIPAVVIEQERAALRLLRSSIFRKDSLLGREERAANEKATISVRACGYQLPPYLLRFPPRQWFSLFRYPRHT